LQPTAQQWHLDELHATATGRGITVAVIDSAVDVDHVDLHTRIAEQRDFVATGAIPAEQHGTAVAGIIAAQADNGLGIVGVAPGARLLALRACQQVTATDGSPATTCRSFALAKALQHAIEERADVINLSLTGPPDRLLARLVDAALARGASVVAAKAPQADGATFPGSHAGVIAVSSDAIDASPGAVLAPGRDIPTTLPMSRWGLVSGSSFAAAQVSGLIAVLRELEGPGPRTRRWWSAHGDRGGPAAAGAGPLDACELARVAAQACVCACLPQPAAAARSDASGG
jgi:subtilisin family serine protease